MRILSCLPLALAACAPSLSAPPSGAAADSAAVAAADEHWLTAYDRHDSTAIRTIFAPEARMIHASGRTSGTEDEVKSVMVPTPPEVAARWRTEGRQVRFYGGAAVASGQYLQQGTYRGEAFTRRYHYTSVYARRGGAWKLVHVHFSPIPGP